MLAQSWLVLSLLLVIPCSLALAVFYFVARDRRRPPPGFTVVPKPPDERR